VFIGLINHTF